MVVNLAMGVELGPIRLKGERKGRAEGVNKGYTTDRMKAALVSRSNNPLSESQRNINTQGSGSWETN